MNSEHHSIGGDVVKLSITKVITAILSLVTVMLLSRFRTLDEYGTYSQLMMVVSIFSSLFMLGLPNSLNYFLGRADTVEERQRFLSNYYTFSTILSGVIGIVLICMVPVISRYFKNPLIHYFIYFLAIFPWTGVVLSSIDNLLVIYHRTEILFIFRLVYGGALLGIIVLVECMTWNFYMYMILLTGISVLFSIMVYFIANSLSHGIRILIDFELLKRLLSFSLPIGFASVVGILTLQADKLLIGYMMDTEHLAIYVNASQELPVGMITGAFTAVLLPHMSGMLKHGHFSNAINLWGYATELSFICICFICSGVFAYAPDVITFLYSEKYISGVSVFRVYAVVLLFRCTYFGMLLNAIGRTRIIFYCSIAALLLNITLNPLMYLIFGMIGPAIATLISLFVIALGQLVFTAKNINIRLRSVFPWKNIGKIFITNIVFGIIFLILKNVLPLNQYLGEVSESIVLGIVWGIFYFFYMWKRIRRTWLCLNNCNDNVG